MRDALSSLDIRGFHTIDTGSLDITNIILKPNTFRKLGSYALVYLENGSGIYEKPSTDPLFVSAGDTIILFPDDPHRYGPRAGHRWQEKWIIFDGLFVRSADQAGHISRKRPIHHIENNPDYLQLWQRAQQESNKQLQNEYFLIIFNRLLEYSCNKGTHLPSALLIAMESLKRISQWKEQNSLNTGAPTKNLRQQIESTGYHYDYIRSLFHSHLCTTPLKYLLSLIMEQAAIMLVKTSLNIREIADACGYQDPYYFSRIFRKTSGVSPKKYRGLYQYTIPPGSL